MQFRFQCVEKSGALGLYCTELLIFGRFLSVSEETLEVFAIQGYCTASNPRSFAAKFLVAETGRTCYLEAQEDLARKVVSMTGSIT